VLAIANRSNATILVTAYGEQFSVKGFGHMISTAIRAAGLPERCKAHGLRKAAARRLVPKPIFIRSPLARAACFCGASAILSRRGRKRNRTRLRARAALR